MHIKLNLGCGHVCPEGWVNVDGSNRAWLASRWPSLDRILRICNLIPSSEFVGKVIYADLTKPFPWEEGSVEYIYMGEILEHFERDIGEKVLHECFRVLKPGGVIRIRVPDNARFWHNYLSEYETTLRRPRDEWDTEHTRWVEMFFRDICVRPPKRFRSMGHYHKWMYDEISLIKLLENLGFHKVERKGYHSSLISDIDRVEVRDDLIIEGVKE